MAISTPDTPPRQAHNIHTHTQTHTPSQPLRPANRPPTPPRVTLGVLWATRADTKLVFGVCCFIRVCLFGCAVQGLLSGFLRKLSFSDSTDTADSNTITLNAFLTYVSLSWKTIIEAIIDNPQAPALSRAPVKPKPAVAAAGAQAPVLAGKSAPEDLLQSTPASSAPAELATAAQSGGGLVGDGGVTGAR